MKQDLQVIERDDHPALAARETVATLKARVQLVQRAMRDIMKEGIHYGTLPGTKKPTLYKPGAETIGLLFAFAPRYRTEDLSGADSIRYRVTCELYSQETGAFIGEGQGEASSDEEKYRWRKAVCAEEYEQTPEDRRREKWAKDDKGAVYTTRQIRQEPADIANTVLKMAEKRSYVDATRTASGCSDMFAQDLEDLPAEVRESLAGEEGHGSRPTPAIGDKDWKKLVKAGDLEGYTEEDILASAAIAGHNGSGPEIPAALADRLYAAMKAHPKGEAEDGQGRLS